MRHRWHHLRCWQGAAQVASSLHERDGYPRSSLMPTPKMDGCLAPTPLCVDSGWALHMGGWACTAPPSLMPMEYVGAHEPTCPARSRSGRASLAPQTSSGGGHHGGLPDFETLEVLEWVRECLLCVTAGEMPDDVRGYAMSLLTDLDVTTTWEIVEALGKEIVRRSAQRRGEK